MAGNDFLANYQNRKLNEIVIPGSHDAGVYTANKDNVKTQSLDIYLQAFAGCRFFDLRIATHKSRVGGQDVYTHKAFHLDQSLVVDHKVKNTPGISSYQNVGHAGGWGGGLVQMLNDAKKFVTQNNTEFLILKFSKSANWSSIAETCIQILGNDQYKGGGNLNDKRVQDLAGKVVTVFDESARDKLAALIRQQVGGHGIMFIRALYDSETGRSSAYDQNYWGIQYFGKFSSTDDVAKNTAKQTKLLTDGATTDIDALGMMYWTTTGLLGNIKNRNDTMWTQTNVAALQQTWKSGLETAITQRFGREKDSAFRLAATTGGALGGRLKAFMPNIVMMDFVDANKCSIVEQLNNVAATTLLKLMVPAPRGPQPHPDPVN